MSNNKQDFFNFSPEDEVQTSPHSNTSASESELIAFTDQIMTMIKSDELEYVIVHVYGTKAKRMNAQEIYGVFNWNPDPSNIGSFHLPTAAKKEIPNLQPGTDYYALVRTPDNEKIGGVLISIKRDPASASNVFKSTNMPVKTQQQQAVHLPKHSEGSIDSLMQKETQEMFQIVFQSYMKRFKDAMEKSLIGGENEEVKNLKSELNTLKGVILEESKRKEEEHKRTLASEKEREIEELKEQIELLHQKMNNPNANQPQQKGKGLSEVLGIVKSLAEAKDVIFPVLEGLGVQIPKLGGGAPASSPINMPPVPNQNVQGGDVYRDTQQVNQTFSGFDEDDISFNGFDDAPSNNNIFENNMSSNMDEGSLEVDPMSYKKMADQMMKIIFAQFKITDVVAEVIPRVKQEVSNTFWTMIKDAGFDENYVIGIGLRDPKAMADGILKYIPTELLSMIQNNPTGKDYSQQIKDDLIDVIKESVKKAIG